MDETPSCASSFSCCSPSCRFAIGLSEPTSSRKQRLEVPTGQIESTWREAGPRHEEQQPQAPGNEGRQQSVARCQTPDLTVQHNNSQSRSRSRCILNGTSTLATTDAVPTQQNQQQSRARAKTTSAGDVSAECADVNARAGHHRP